MSDEECIFCKIVAGSIPARIAHESQNVIAFHDINPTSPVHILIIPRNHIASLNDLTTSHDALVAEMFHVARRVTREAGIDQTGYQILIRTGRDGGQEVDHIHIHINGGTSIGK